MKIKVQHSCAVLPPLCCGKVATCLGTGPRDVGEAAFPLAWEEVQVFAWQKHSLSELVQNMEDYKWRILIAKFQWFLLEAHRLTEDEINQIIIGLLEDPDSL
jgi:hypothetical protein